MRPLNAQARSRKEEDSSLPDGGSGIHVRAPGGETGYLVVMDRPFRFVTKHGGIQGSAGDAVFVLSGDGEPVGWGVSQDALHLYVALGEGR